MAQVSIFLRKHDPAVDSAPHRCTRTFAARLAALFPRLVTYDREKAVLRLLTDESWSAIKGRLRPLSAVGVITEVVQDSGYAHPWSWRPTGQRLETF